MNIRVMIADDHGLIRQGLRMYLSAAPGIEVVGEAVDGADAVRLARELQPDVVLMDLLMPRMDGIAAISSLHRDTPCIRVIALTAAEDHRLLRDAVTAGAVGYFLKNVDAQGLCRAIYAAAAGEVEYSPEVMAAMQRDARLPGSVALLTPRELGVLRLVAQGLSNKEIGRALCIRERTVKNHVASILAKLGCASRTQAIVYAGRVGLVALSGQ